MKKFLKNNSFLSIAILAIITLTALSGCAKKNGFECPNKISILSLK